jgi:hypothetical protein
MLIPKPVNANTRMGRAACVKTRATQPLLIATICGLLAVTITLIVLLAIRESGRQKKKIAPSPPSSARVASDRRAINEEISTVSNKEHRSAPTMMSHGPQHQYQQQHQQQQNCRAGAPRRYGIANPRESQHHQPLYEQPAAMPSMQLNVPATMPQATGSYVGVPSGSNVIGEAEMDMKSTYAMGTSANHFSDGNYQTDPGMMTPSTTSDIRGLQTFMPYMGGGVGDNGDGPVDPSTGLPLFTTGKLVRSQLLGGMGAGSFLRQVQDPLSGARRIGKAGCGSQLRRRDFEVRRKQFNAARLETNDGSPVLFNESGFAYF